jgi:predicted RNase H-like HicB family nuclease
MIKIYPAVCAREENGYSVFLPDFNNVATCGDDLEDAISMATDLIAVMIYSNREEGCLFQPLRDLKISTRKMLRIGLTVTMIHWTGPCCRFVWM